MQYDIIHRPQCLIARRNHHSPVDLSHLLRNDYLREKSQMQTGEPTERSYLNYVSRNQQRNVSIVDFVGKEQPSTTSHLDSYVSRTIEQMRLPLIQSVIFKTIEDRKSVELERSGSRIRTLKYPAEDVLPKSLQSSQVIHHKILPRLKPNARQRYNDQHRIPRRKSPNSRPHDEKKLENELKLAEQTELTSISDFTIQESAKEALRVLQLRRKKRKKSRLPVPLSCMKPSPSRSPSPSQLGPTKLEPWETLDYQPDFQRLE